MRKVIEFRGRLSRSDKRPANPGRYDMLFALHPGPRGSAVIWNETLRGVDVTPGGFFSVILGALSPLEAATFKSVPRWLSMRVVRSGQVDDEHAPRTPMCANDIRLAEDLESVTARLGELETMLLGRTGKVDALAQLTDATEQLFERVVSIEDGDDSLVLHHRIDQLGQQVEKLSGERGRVTRLEDEIEDLVGPDGDVVDLNERMDRLEGKAPELIAALRAREDAFSGVTLERIQEALDILRIQVANTDQRLRDLKEEVPEAQAPVTADGLGAVLRTGDVMTGGLTINRGGLEVLSGGITCRGASVTTVEASNLIKTPKLIADAVEVRGDLTVDNTHRAIQCRLIEGRQGSSRKDGALHINTRGGAEVVVGHPDARKGLDVRGPVSGDNVVTAQGGLAQTFTASGPVKDGDVVCITADGSRAGRCAKDADPRVIGVSTGAAGVLGGGGLSSGKVAVAVAGVVMCKVDADAGAISPGTLLTASARSGHARAARLDADGPGAILGKALGALASGRGMVPVLLGCR